VAPYQNEQSRVNRAERGFEITQSYPIIAHFLTLTMASSNFIEIKSSKHFQDSLSQDLNRVSVISFWTPWAEPCKQMNEVAKELSQKYKAALFLQVSNE